jgi:hypothetical protein
MSAFTQPAYSLLYRGNSVNGWLSAFVSSTALRSQGLDVAFYPLCGHRVMTKKEVEAWKGTSVLLLDLDLEQEEKNKETLLEGGVLSVEAITASPSGETSTLVEVWRRWYGEAEKPFWLTSMDRIIRWSCPTWEDRCLREVFLPLAHMRPLDALRATEAFMTWTVTPMEPEFQGIMTQAQARLMEKGYHLSNFLRGHGVVHVIQEDDAKAWGLTPEWVGLRAFLLDNTDTVLDTNEAAHLVFVGFPDVALFVNYRKKARKSVSGEYGMAYLYSARSKAFDLTTGGFFHGRAGSAGAQVPVGKDGRMPFVVSSDHMKM